MNNQLVKINTDNERQTVSARTLWEFLERPYRDFKPWFDKFKEYGFTDNQDFRAVTVKIVTAQGNQMDALDYEITLDMAKELSMLQRTEKGKQARQYFIEIEKSWNTPELIMARALQMSNIKLIEYKEKVCILENKIKEDEPKVKLAESITKSEDCINIDEMAKILSQNGFEVGRNKFYQELRKSGYIMKNSEKQNIPTQKAVNLNLFKLNEYPYKDTYGNPKLARTTLVTGKGQLYFTNKYLNSKD